MAQQQRHRQQQPLDVLQSMINGVLLETGKALHAANKKGLSTLGHTNIPLQAFIPSAADKFHLALDELESDIMHARAVLVRDLQEIRAKQYALDHPSIEQTSKTNDIAELPKPDDEIAKVPIEEVIQEDAAKEFKDEAMEHGHTNGLAEPEKQDTAMAQDQLVQKEEQLEHFVMPSETPPEKKDAEPEATKGNAVASMTEEATGLGINMDGGNETKPDATVPKNQAEDDIDFESMFGMQDDGDDNSGNADINFDDMFTNDGPNDQHIDLAGGGDFDLSSFGEQATAGHEDVTAMLESLDNFGNAGNGDFDMMDISKPNATGDLDAERQNSENAGQESFDLSGKDLDLALGLNNNESTFDDLLEGIDFGDGGDDGAGLDTMEHGEFDDAFFGTE